LYCLDNFVKRGECVLHPGFNIPGRQLANWLGLRTLLLRWRPVLAVILLVVIVICIYRHAYLDYARRDHIVFIAERNSFPGTGDWFTHAMNYTRTRISSPGDYFLFRPGLYFFLTLNDIFLRQNLLVAGIFTILLHLGVVFLLYFTLCRFFKGSSWPFFFAALFASQHMGVEMVSWRHISTYMFSASLGLASLILLSLNERRKYMWAGFLLFLSMTFHEVQPAAIALLLTIVLLVHYFKGRPLISGGIIQGHVICLLSAALITYFVLNFFNWLITKPPSFIGPADHFSSVAAFLKESVRNFVHYLGTATRAVLYPFSMKLSWDKTLDDWAYFTWDMTAGDIRGYLAWGTLGVILIASAVGICLRRIWQAREEGAEIITLWACCGLVSLTLIYSLGRLTLRSAGYSVTSTYYYWFFSFFYMIILKFLIDEALAKLPQSRLRQGLVYAGGALLAAMILAQTCMARDTLKENYDLTWANHIRQAVKTSEVYFTLNPDACLDTDESNLGKPPRELQYFTLPYYLNKYNCGWVKGTAVVHLLRTNEGITVIRPGPYPAEYVEWQP